MLPTKVSREKSQGNMILNFLWPEGQYKKWFAGILENGLVDYEKNIAERKSAIFKKFVPENSTVLDIGLGAGPNLKYIPQTCKVLGLEPNRFTWTYAQGKAETLGIDLQIFDETAENMTLQDETIDVVISTLTLCSVSDPVKVIQQVGRVLKPGGRFIFIEHTYSPDERLVQIKQTLCNPLQRFVADGCNLTRDTERSIRTVGAETFEKIEIERFKVSFTQDANSFNVMSPHISGYALKYEK